MKQVTTFSVMSRLEEKSYPLLYSFILDGFTYYHRRFQTRASPGIARVKFWSIMLIDYRYILRDDRAEFSNGKSKARQLGGGA